MDRWIYHIHGFYWHMDDWSHAIFFLERWTAPSSVFFSRNLRVDWIGLAGRIMKCMPPPTNGAKRQPPCSRLACRHRYHYECLMTWCAHARRANVILCPVCRQHHPLRESWDSKKHPVRLRWVWEWDGFGVSAGGRTIKTIRNVEVAVHGNLQRKAAGKAYVFVWN